LNQEDNAIAAFNEAIRLQTDYAACLLESGNAYTSKAIRQRGRGLWPGASLQPGNAEAYAAEATRMLKNRALDNAVADYSGKHCGFGRTTMILTLTEVSAYGTILNTLDKALADTPKPIKRKRTTSMLRRPGDAYVRWGKCQSRRRLHRRHPQPAPLSSTHHVNRGNATLP